MASNLADAPILNPMLYLFWMAIQDSVFKKAFQLQGLLTVNLYKLPTSQTSWELWMKDKALDKPVFASFHNVGRLAYEPDPTQGWG